MPLNYSTRIGLQEIAYLDFLMHPEGVMDEARSITDPAKLATMINEHFSLKGRRVVEPTDVSSYLAHVSEIRAYAQKTKREMSHLAVLLEWQMHKHALRGTENHEMDIGGLTLCLNDALGYTGSASLSTERVDQYITELAQMHSGRSKEEILREKRHLHEYQNRGRRER